jgi:hypothetical protein
MVGGGVGGSVAAVKLVNNKLPLLRKLQASSLKHPFVPLRYKRKRRPVRLRYKRSQPVKRRQFKSVLLSKLLKRGARLVSKENFYSLFNPQVLTPFRVFKQAFHRAVSLFALLRWISFKPILATPSDCPKAKKRLSVQAAARGGLISGPAFKAASRFGQEMGSQEFQNAFARAQTERANALNPLLALYGTGAETAGALVRRGRRYGQFHWQLFRPVRPSSSGAFQGAGQAAAGGITGAAGAGAQGVYGAGQAGAQAVF